MMLGKCIRLTGKTLVSLNQDGFKVTCKKIINKLYNKYVRPEIIELEPAVGFNCLYQDDRIEPVDDIGVKALAFYLPQFHTFPENDEWWGKGFTEWTNTRKSTPRYWNHYQPREPHEDIGYYDLTDVEAIKRQAKQAREHGLYGFCMYYYWFSGKTLMETPLELLRTHPEIDINYCLCWANESWTRAWDGLKENVLIEQKYEEKDAPAFIEDIKKYLDDKRYMRHQGKPVIIVYNPGDIPETKKVFECWKEKAREMGIGEISIWTCRSFRNDIEALGVAELVDKEVEFPPHNFADYPIVKNPESLLVDNACVLDYTDLVDHLLEDNSGVRENPKLCRSVMLGWDNSARRDKGFNTFDNFDIGQYHRWLRSRVNETLQYRAEDDRYIFINAWNEWAEGTYLEPDKRYGYAYLNTTTQALRNKDYCLETVVENRPEEAPARIAVQAHVFYVDLIEDIIRYMNNIPEPYDCYITTNSPDKAERILAALQAGSCARKYTVSVCGNKGRDVAPFLMQLQGIAKSYDYICHVHSKRSKHGSFGDKWRAYLFTNLLGSAPGIAEVIKAFDEDDKLGLIYPNTFWHVKAAIEWGSNRSYTANLLHMLGVEVTLGEVPVFPAGDMLWFRSKAVEQLFDHKLTWDDFPEELGQLDGTIMHAVERAWVYIAQKNGYSYKNMNISPVKE